VAREVSLNYFIKNSIIAVLLEMPKMLLTKYNLL